MLIFLFIALLLVISIILWIIFPQVIGRIISYGFGWLVICGIIYWATLCFGWTFSWLVPTGIWLIICFIISRI